MSLFIASLNSGSNGNCYYVGNAEEAVLVDAGISCREVEKRMQRLQLDIKKIMGIFISHEHTDHIRGLYQLSTKYEIPVYISQLTLRNSRLRLKPHLIKVFNTNQATTIGQLGIQAFAKKHDACDPCSFLIEDRGTRVGVFTDIGMVCDNLVKHFSQCHAVFLEANYDEEMLANGGYPYVLKKRITGGLGHLSNRQALELFMKSRAPYLSHVLLSHLSKNNNCPDLVQQLFEAHANGVRMIVASRYNESEVYQVCGSAGDQVEAVKIKLPAQLSFSFS